MNQNTTPSTAEQLVAAKKVVQQLEEQLKREEAVNHPEESASYKELSGEGLKLKMRLEDLVEQKTGVWENFPESPMRHIDAVFQDLENLICDLHPNI